MKHQEVELDHEDRALRVLPSAEYIVISVPRAPRGFGDVSRGSPPRGRVVYVALDQRHEGSFQKHLIGAQNFSPPGGERRSI